MSGDAPRIGLFGVFDVDDGGHAVVPRVLGAELRRRLPGAEVRAFAPLGLLRPLPADGGRPAEPLGERDAGRLAALAARLDAVVVAGDDVLGGAGGLAGLYGDDPRVAPAPSWFVEGLDGGAEPPAPVVWAAVGGGGEAVGVADVAMRRGPVGVLDGPPPGWPPGVVWVPHPALLAPRLLGPDLLRNRADFLRLMGWVPAEPFLAVEGDADLLPAVTALAEVLGPAVENGRVGVLLLATGGLRGEETFAGALEEALGGRCRRLPGGASLEETAAALSLARGYLGASSLGVGLSAALGVPLAVPSAAARHRLLLEALRVTHPAGEPAARGAARLLGSPEQPRPDAAVATLDAYLDRVAARLAEAPPSGPSPVTADTVEPGDLRARYEALVVAHRVRTRQRDDDRLAYQAEVSRLRAETRDLEALREEVERLRRELAAARALADKVTTSRTWRYTEGAREVYGRLRRGRR